MWIVKLQKREIAKRLTPDTLIKRLLYFASKEKLLSKKVLRLEAR